MGEKISNINHHLKSASAKTLIAEIRELYRFFLPVREYYALKLSKNGDAELLKKYKKIIKDEFMPDRGLGKARLSIARRAVLDFMKLSSNDISIADVMLHYVEMGVEFTLEYGDIDEPFYASVESMYEKAARFTTERGLGAAFKIRFEKIVRDTSDMGWGFHDSLDDMFSTYFSDMK